MKMPIRLGMLGRMNRWMRLPAACAALALAACGPLHRSVVIEPSGGSAHAPSSRVVRTATTGGAYRVVQGDTLYAIAFHAGVDFRELAKWNRIPPPYTIWPGQLLRLSPSGATASNRSPSRAPREAAPARATAEASAPVFLPAGTPVNNRPASKAPAIPASSAAAPLAGVATPPSTLASAPVAPVPRGASRSAGGVTWRWPADGSLIKRFKDGDAIPGIEVAGDSGEPVRAAADGVVVYSGNGLVGYGELVIIKHNDSFLSAYGHNRKRMVREGQRVSAGQQIAEMGSTGASRVELQFQIRRDGNPVDPLQYLPGR
jgi:lipoprotein NlpD